MIVIAYEGSIYHSSWYDGWDGLPVHVHIIMGSQTSSKWSLTLITNLVPPLLSITYDKQSNCNYSIKYDSHCV